ncbi:MAG: phage tail sheath subtilisin-like domain-containing protein, partial [Pseudomonadota bacterium]
AFFENGGRQLYVARVLGGVNGTDETGRNGSAAAATVTDANTRVRFDARFPGSGGNLTLEFTWDDSQSLLRATTVTEIEDGETALLEIAGDLPGASFNGTGAHAGFPLRGLTALVTRAGNDLVFVANTNARVINADPAPLTPVSVPVTDIGAGIAIATLPQGAVLRRVRVAPPVGAALAAGTAAELRLSRAADVSDFVANQSGWGALRTLRGTLNAAGTVFTVAAAPMNVGVGAAYDLTLAALAGAPGAAEALFVQRGFSVDVLESGEPIATFADIPLTAAGLPGAMPVTPEGRFAQLTQPVSAAITAGSTPAQIHAALFDMMIARDAALVAAGGTAELTPPADSPRRPLYRITLAGGTDGDVPSAADYGGETNELLGSTGFAALEEVEDISIVLTPAAAVDPVNHQGIAVQMQIHCERMRYRFGIVDSRQGMALSEVRAFRDNFDTTRMALYYPWVDGIDPTGAQPSIPMPPSGFLAGIYARTDVQRGVHKAPANTPVFGALRFGQGINQFQQELLNPAGVNCLRSFSGRGHQVWGARTMSSDPEWRYVNVRRYFLFLERSIERGTSWVVFEPNGEALWANVRTTIEDFLYNEWVSGHLLGATPRAAFFVRCDRSTMTQNDIDNGRLICEIGVAPLRPAEFVIFRIGQITGQE